MEELEKGYRFRSPAPETLKRLAEGDLKFQHFDNCMNNLSTDFKLMKQKQDIIAEKIDQHIIEQKEQFEGLNKKIDGFLTGCDTKYATKSFQSVVEKIGWALLFLIIGALVAAFFKLVLK